MITLIYKGIYNLCSSKSEEKILPMQIITRHYFTCRVKYINYHLFQNKYIFKALLRAYQHFNWPNLSDDLLFTLGNFIQHTFHMMVSNHLLELIPAKPVFVLFFPLSKVFQVQHKVAPSYPDVRYYFLIRQCHPINEF